MTRGLARFGEKAVCPECGYDLRGAPRAAEGGVRCAECGERVRAGRSASRLAFVRARGFSGKCWGYVVTVVVICTRPATLAKEVRRRVPGRAARLFHWVSIFLLTGIMAGTLYAFKSLEIDRGFYFLTADYLWKPIQALRDSWWELAPLLIGIFLAARVVVGVYRLTMLFGCRDLERWRLARVTCFASATMVVQAMLLGGLAILLGVLRNHVVYTSDRQSQIVAAILRMGCTFLGGLAVTVFLVPSIGLVTRAGRWKWLRIGLVLLALPLVAVTLGAAIVMAVYWAMGYIALALRSMML